MIASDLRALSRYVIPTYSPTTPSDTMISPPTNQTDTIRLARPGTTSPDARLASAYTTIATDTSN